MNIQSDENFSWYSDLKESIKPEYSAVKINNVLSFYKLKGRTNTLAIENTVPIAKVAYTVRSESEDRYYLHYFRDYSLDELFFYRRTLTFSGEDEAVENLRRYVADGNITLLLTPEQVADTQDMLKRVWKSVVKTEGQLDYRLYIELLETSLKYQDYKSMTSLTGYKTACNIFDENICDIWNRAREKGDRIST